MHSWRKKQSRRWSLRLPVVALISAVTLTLGTMTAYAAVAPSPAQTGTPVGKVFINSRGDRCYHTSTSPSAPAHCVHFQRGLLHPLTPAQRAALRKAMSHPLASHPATSAQPAQVSTAPPQCSFGLVVNTPDRFTSCSENFGAIITQLIGPFGTITTGVIGVDLQQWASYSTTAGFWDHGMNMAAFGGQGTMLAGVDVTVSSSCDVSTALCFAFSNTNPDPQTVTLVNNGPAILFDWTEFDVGASAIQAGATNTLDNTLGVNLIANVPGYPPIPASDTGVLPGRCDSIVSNVGNDGCVDEQFTPTMNLSRSIYGSSADMIAWAQNNLSGHWGLQGKGQPLHRLMDPVLILDNRTIICQDGSFTPDPTLNTALAPYKDKDSCDEFPFAGTYESGAKVEDVNGNPKPFVNTGADCAQVTAVKTGTSGNEATDWATTTVVGTPTLTEPCVRGHIPLSQNTNATGTAYSTTITVNHLIDKDAFWLLVSP